MEQIWQGGWRRECIVAQRSHVAGARTRVVSADSDTPDTTERTAATAATLTLMPLYVARICDDTAATAAKPCVTGDEASGQGVEATVRVAEMTV